MSIRKATEDDADELFGLAKEFATSFVPERAEFEIALADIISTDGVNLADMSLLEDGRAKLLKALRELSPSDTLGSAGVATGIVLVVFGIVLQESSGVGFGATIRSMGGVFLLGGLGAVLFVESRRRAAAIGAARCLGARYMAMTANWGWPDRVGMAGVAIGLVLLAPALVLQIIFGTPFGAIVIAPGIVLFWSGIALLVYGRFHRRDARSYSSPSRRGGRGARR